MKIIIEPFGLVKREYFNVEKNPQGEGIACELPEGSTIGDVVELYRMEKAFISLFILNGRHCSIDSELRNNDKLQLIPPSAGG